MRIAVITNEYWPYIRGGSGISSTLLVNQLRQRGHHVDVYVFDKKYHNSFGEHGSTQYFKNLNPRIWPLSNLLVIIKLFRKIKNYDIIHVYSTIQIGALGFLRLLFKTPTVATLNGEEAACLYLKRWINNQCNSCTPSTIIYCANQRSKELVTLSIPFPVLAIYFIIQKYFAKNIDSYFALSRPIKSLYVSSGFPLDKIVIIPNMFDPLFMDCINNKVETKSEKIIVLYAGRLIKDKGVDDLLKAFIAIEPTNTELWIAGCGPEENNLKDIVEKSNCRNISFLGFVPPNKMYEIYKKADIFVHPGRWPEPFGRTILEAMLAKLAIIVSDIGAPPDILSDAGLVYNVGNIPELSSNLALLIRNKKTRMDMGVKAYSKAIKDYSPSTVTLLITREYERLTMNKR